MVFYLYGYFFCYDEPHLQYQPSKHEIKEKSTALVQYKRRYIDPYLQPEEYKNESNKQTKKLLSEK